MDSLINKFKSFVWSENEVEGYVMTENKDNGMALVLVKENGKYWKTELISKSNNIIKKPQEELIKIFIK